MRSPAPAFHRETKYVLRALLRRPAFTTICVATLAVGIAAVTTVYSVVNALLLRPLPYATPDRLVAILPGEAVANREIDALRTRSRMLDQVAGFSPGWLMALTGAGEPRQLNGARVTGNLFAMLGVGPRLGRTFGLEAETPGNDGIVVLGYDLWMSAFGGDSAILGRSITLDQVPRTVIGVMPAGFQVFGQVSDLWFPLTMDQSAMTWAGANGLAYGRLRPGTTLSAAREEMTGLVGQLREEFQLRPGWGTGVGILGLRESIVGGIRPMLLVLLAAVAFLLLIACANVANLLMVRTSERHLELAVRTALGAAPATLARLLLTEACLLAGTGGLLGVVLARVGVGQVRRLLPASMPRLAEISVDARVMAVALAIIVGAAVVVGLLPLLQLRSAGLAEWLRKARGTTREAERARGLLVALEVALAVVLTAGTALMTRTMTSLMSVDPGLRPDHLLTMRMQPTGFDDNEARRAYWRQVLAEVRAMPGVLSAGTILHLPTSGRSWHADVSIEGRAQDPGAAPPRTAWQAISTGYLETAGVPLIRGRLFGEGDRADAPRVILVNTAFASTIFAGQDPIGTRITAGNATNGDWATIVGVVGSVRHDSLNVPPAPEVYVPFEQRSVGATSLVIRTAGDPVAVAGAIRDRIWTVNRDVPVSDVRTMGSLYSASLEKPRLVLVLLGGFSVVGILLGAVGMYGVVSYTVRQRRREIGIRIALGALPRAVVQQVVGLGLRQTALGLLVGLPAALILTRFLRGLIYGVSPADPVSLITVSGLLLLVAVGATLLPARRAAAVPPSVVLKE